MNWLVFFGFVFVIYLVLKSVSSPSMSKAKLAAWLEMEIRSQFPPIAKSRLMEEFPDISEHFTVSLLSDVLSKEIQTAKDLARTDSFLGVIEKAHKLSKAEEEQDIVRAVSQAFEGMPMPVRQFIEKERDVRYDKFRRAIHSAMESASLESFKVVQQR